MTCARKYDLGLQQMFLYFPPYYFPFSSILNFHPTFFFSASHYGDVRGERSDTGSAAEIPHNNKTREMSLALL